MISSSIDGITRNDSSRKQHLKSTGRSNSNKNKSKRISPTTIVSSSVGLTSKIPKMLFLQTLCRSNGGGGDRRDDNTSNSSNNNCNKMLSQNATFHTAQITGCYSFRSPSSTLVSSKGGTRISALRVFEHRRRCNVPVAAYLNTKKKSYIPSNSSCSEDDGVGEGSCADGPSLLWVLPSHSSSSSPSDNLKKVLIEEDISLISGDKDNDSEMGQEEEEKEEPSCSMLEVVKKSVNDLALCCTNNETQTHFYLARLTSLLNNMITSPSDNKSFKTVEDRKTAIIELMVQNGLIETLINIMKHHTENIFIQHMTLVLLGELGANSAQNQQVMVHTYKAAEMVQRVMAHHIISPSLCLQASMTLYKMIHCLPFVNEILIQLKETKTSNGGVSENDNCQENECDSNNQSRNNKERSNHHRGNPLKQKLTVMAGAVSLMEKNIVGCNNTTKGGGRLITIRKVMLLHSKHTHIQQYLFSVLCLLSIMPIEQSTPSSLQNISQLRSSMLQDPELLHVIFQVLKYVSKCTTTSSSSISSHEQQWAIKQAGFILSDSSVISSAEEESVMHHNSTFCRGNYQLPVMKLGAKFLHTLLMKQHKNKDHNNEDECLMQTLIHYCQAPSILCQMIQHHVLMTAGSGSIHRQDTGNGNDDNEDMVFSVPRVDVTAGTTSMTMDNTLLFEGLESLYVLVSYCISHHQSHSSNQTIHTTTSEDEKSSSSVIICNWDLLLLNDATCRLLDHLEHIIRNPNTSQKVRHCIEHLLYLLLDYEDHL